jgi:hypothetical protein
VGIREIENPRAGRRPERVECGSETSALTSAGLSKVGASVPRDSSEKAKAIRNNRCKQDFTHESSFSSLDSQRDSGTDVNMERNQYTGSIIVKKRLELTCKKERVVKVYTKELCVADPACSRIRCGYALLRTMGGPDAMVDAERTSKQTVVNFERRETPTQRTR